MMTLMLSIKSLDYFELGVNRVKILEAFRAVS